MLRPLHKAALSSLLLPLLLTTPPLQAETLLDQQAVDAIVGSKVHEEQATAATEPQKVIAAIEKTPQSTATVRKVSKLEKVDIVFLTDSTRAEGGPPPEVEAKLKEHEQEIKQLRGEIEGNAMLYHALDSRQILVKDILAVEFDNANGILIYAAAKPPSSR